MLAAPLRRIKRIWPYLILVALLIGLLIWLKSALRRDLVRHKTIFRGKYNQEEYVDRNGVKVVIGHYIGNAARSIPNATNDMINSNNFNPQPNAGKNGNPVMIDAKDLLVMQQVFQINRFNIMASDRIPLNRTLPDYRRKKCSLKYDDYLTYPNTSVIIVFHNEAWSTLLRTVWSVINRSPKELLVEIILVDDASERTFLKKPLDDYIVNLPVSIKLIRLSTRSGLIKARVTGAKAATGQVLTFLDAHCECTKGWLVSLLSVIKNDRKTVVCPVIDNIQEDTFGYSKSFEYHWGAFNWHLQFRWFTLPIREVNKLKSDPIQPFVTPAMAGGLFSIDREYFFEIGSYDEDMNIWGGENLEMSFRIWQCGGKIKITPCSHVGHVFRKSSPHTFPGGINQVLYSNLARVALVWMDEYAEIFFKYSEHAQEMRNSQNITSRQELRKKLQCKSFKWYLNTVWPEHFFPKDDDFYGRIRNVNEDLCLLRPMRTGFENQPMGEAKIDKCMDDSMPDEIFLITKEGFIATDDNICLDAPEREERAQLKVRIMGCSQGSRQKWEYNKKTKEIRHLTNQKCLDVAGTQPTPNALIITKCNGDDTQKWELDPVKWR